MKRIFFIALLYVILGISVITHLIGFFTTSNFIASLISFISFIGISMLLFYSLNQNEELKERLWKIRKQASEDIRHISLDLSISQNMRASAERNLKVLSTALDQLQEEHTTALKELEALRKKLAKLEELHPRLSERIDSLIVEEQKEIDIETAKTFDSLVEPVLNTPISTENEKVFKELIDKFEELTDSQKEYVHSDIAHIREKYDSFKKLRWQQQQQQAAQRRRREEEERRRRQRQRDDEARRRRMQTNTVLQILRS